MIQIREGLERLTLDLRELQGDVAVRSGRSSAVPAAIEPDRGDARSEDLRKCRRPSRPSMPRKSGRDGELPL